MARGEAVRRVATRSDWREDDARVIVDDWRESGAGLATFARRYGVGPRRIRHWDGLGDREQQAVRFHPVRLVDGLERSRSRATIEIELVGDRRVHVVPGSDADDQQGVLAVSS